VENPPDAVGLRDDARVPRDAQGRPIGVAVLRVGVVALVAVVLGVAASGCAASPSAVLAPRASPATAAEPGAVVRSAEREERARVAAASRLLRRWDSRRAAAYARGDVTALRRLYAPASGAGRADVDLLQRYVERRLVVRGMQAQVLALHVRRWTRHRVVLLARDRLVGAVAAAAHGRPTRRALPADGVDRWRLTLERRADHWVMSAVVTR
jgi:hypothetical protein